MFIFVVFSLVIIVIFSFSFMAFVIRSISISSLGVFCLFQRVCMFFLYLFLSRTCGAGAE